jgi:ABC-type uncharacterized transport system ATPase subunit
MQHLTPIRLRLDGVTKRFPQVLAVDRVSLEVQRGEVHALLGENGAGKTTLMRVAFGLYQPDEGTIEVDGVPRVIRSPRVALDLGLAMVHQHSTLIPTLTVVENFVFGLPAKDLLVDLRSAAARISSIAAKYELEADPWARAEDLSIGRQQRVEILRALYLDAQVIIFDEPTTSLAVSQTGPLFEVMRKLAAEGRSIVFITHKLREVFAVSDRITVLRQGRVAGELATADAEPRMLSRLMVGRQIEVAQRTAASTDEEQSDGEKAAELTDVWTSGREQLRGLRLEVRFGEVLGIAGVEGNGQRDLAEILVGLKRQAKGQVWVLGTDISGLHTDEIAALGVGFVPEDRHSALILDLSIKENLVLRRLDRLRFVRRGLIDQEAITQHAREVIARFAVAGGRPNTLARILSGGNQQKVILARELQRDPKLLVAAQPTRGLDIAATAYVRSLILAHRDRGAAVVFISSDLDELFEVSDRLAVLLQGQIVGVVPAQEAQREEIGLMMAGEALNASGPAGEGAEA